MDREKVIKGHECCQISMSEENPFEKCEECPYNYIGISVQDCRSVLSGNTLELLKEQGKRKFLIDEKGNITPLPEIVRCKDCIYGDDFDCPAPLPTGYLCQKGHGSHTGDWFCADGGKR